MSVLETITALLHEFGTIDYVRGGGEFGPKRHLSALTFEWKKINKNYPHGASHP